MNRSRAACKQPVRVREETVVMPEYAAGAPERLPMFLENRVYQGSSGKVYPCAITERIAATARPRGFRAVFLENGYLQLMLLPEIGGRIHAGRDQTNGYDFFYRQRVIKPALVGLLGPWISGGVEFNWPQHHRPSTFQPVHYRLEARADGGCTVWLGEHDPMERMKCLLGISLAPGEARIEAKVRLFNRTPRPQTFLWWANAGVHVHDEYQAFFPPDVAKVADHARRAVTEYPIARGQYYGVDYGPGTDISWWHNLPVPTSYMVAASHFDFMGGYDHRRRAGLVAVADHHIAPGKKLWTWGNSEFGRAWERNLTDKDGPYIELMTGVYTDNQPDFSWLQPYETREFSHYWYPIQRIGPVKNANRRLAVNLEIGPRRIRAGVCACETMAARVVLRAGERRLWEADCKLAPGEPFVRESAPAQGATPESYRLQVFDRDGRELIRYRPWPAEARAVAGAGGQAAGEAYEIEAGIAARCDGAWANAAPAREPPPPARARSSDELNLIAAHLEQYRHATRSPEPYWREALRRDSGDPRAHLGLGRRHLRQGQFTEAVNHFQAAIARLTVYNSNPEAGEAFYLLGEALQYLGRREEARIGFYKSVWSAAWRGAGFYALARLAARQGEYPAALDHLEASLAADGANLNARNLKAALLRRLHQGARARKIVTATLALDPLDLWSQHEASLLGLKTSPPASLSADPQLALDVAFDYAGAGFWREAGEVLAPHCQAPRPPAMALYAAGYLALQAGEAASVRDWYRRAGRASADYCFPSRLEEMLALEAALAEMPGDSRAHYYLGCLYYDKQRHEDAARHWERAAALDPDFAPAWRNLALAEYRVRRHAEKARQACRRALAAALAAVEAEAQKAAAEASQAEPPGLELARNDAARILEELDQLEDRLGAAPAARLERLEQAAALVRRRDTLVLERAALLLRLDRPRQALAALAGRRFHPWEGGEGRAAEVYTEAHLRLSEAARADGQARAALAHCRAARRLPENLGEFRHPLSPLNRIEYQTALALRALGKPAAARQAFERAAAAPHPAMPQSPAAEYWRGLALRALGRRPAARACVPRLQAEAKQRLRARPAADYFATSVPDFSAFPKDPTKAAAAEARLLAGLAQLLAGRRAEARKNLMAALRLDPMLPGAASAIRSMNKPSQPTR